MQLLCHAIGDNMGMAWVGGWGIAVIAVIETPKARISVIPTSMQGLHRAVYQYYVYSNSCLDDITTDCAAIRTDSSYKGCQDAKNLDFMVMTSQ